MKQILSHKWLIKIGLILIGLALGYLIQLASLQKYVTSLLANSSEIITEEKTIGYDNQNNLSDQFIYFQVPDNSIVSNKYYFINSLIYFASICLVFLIYYLLHKVHLRVVDKIKKDNEKFYLIQMELIRNQLDPHFLFNALNSISYSIHSDDRKLAYSNLGLFSKFLRGSIGSLDEFSRPLEEELEYVENYLILEKFRFKEKFDYDFIIGPGVNKSTVVPKLILFSFIESALKKGVLPKSIGGKIDITIDVLGDKDIYLMISDTGLYRNIENTDKSHTKNMMLMKRVVSYFNQYNLNKIDIKMTDMGNEADPKGSKVEITIPSEYMYMV